MLMAALRSMADELQSVRAKLTQAPEPTPAIPLNLHERLRTQLQNLGSELSGGGVHAVRAKEIIRSLIDRVVPTPVEDKRGAGALRLEIHGRIAALLQIADVPPSHRVKMVAGTRFTTARPAIIATLSQG
jgi:hypothetical protein